MTRIDYFNIMRFKYLKIKRNRREKKLSLSSRNILDTAICNKIHTLMSSFNLKWELTFFFPPSGVFGLFRILSSALVYLCACNEATRIYQRLQVPWRRPTRFIGVMMFESNKKQKKKTITTLGVLSRSCITSSVQDNYDARVYRKKDRRRRRRREARGVLILIFFFFFITLHLPHHSEITELR